MLARRLPVIVFVLIPSLADFARAGVIFNGGWAESRAYSALTPETDIVKHRHEVTLLPFDAATVATAGSTTSNASYQLAASAAGARFQWNVQQARDGAGESFGVAEGELAFRVEEPLPFTLSGDYDYSGPGRKFAFYRLYDNPADTVPIFQWAQTTSDGGEVSLPVAGAGELLPGVGYRLTFRLLLDNLVPSDVATVSAQIGFTIGDPDEPALPGDADGNGRVDVVDLNHVRNNFGQQGDGVLGDTYPFDGSVDIVDLNAVRNNFGAVRAESVPEPAGAGLLMMSCLPLALACFRSTTNPLRGMMRSSG